MKAIDRAACYEAALKEIIQKRDILVGYMFEKVAKKIEATPTQIAHCESFMVAGDIAQKALLTAKPVRITRKQMREHEKLYPMH